MSLLGTRVLVPINMALLTLSFKKILFPRENLKQKNQPEIFITSHYVNANKNIARCNKSITEPYQNKLVLANSKLKGFGLVFAINILS